MLDQYSDSGGLNVNALCDELSKRVMQWTYTVFEVFNALTERGFDQAAHEQVATNLINRINPANLINENDRETRDFVNPSTKAHNNHLHVIFPGGN